MPFNPCPAAPYECLDLEKIEKLPKWSIAPAYASARAPRRGPRHHGGLRSTEERERQGTGLARMAALRSAELARMPH